MQNKEWQDCFPHPLLHPLDDETQVFTHFLLVEVLLLAALWVVMEGAKTELCVNGFLCRPPES